MIFTIDVVMESLAGVELYQVLKTSGDPSTQRKILVTKWMYVHGFLNKDFPLTEKYIPDHLADDF